jgi:hypothetical protein
MTTVVNIKTDVYDIYIGRHVDPVIGKWGNPYSSKEDTLAKFKVSSKKEAIQKYREYILSNKELLSSLPELHNKRLGCFCKPGTCHGDVLVELAEEGRIGFHL